VGQLPHDVTGRDTFNPLVACHDIEGGSVSTIETITERGAKVARANGIDIAYTDTGDGPPLVLLHGGLSSTGPGWTGSHAAHLDHLGTLGKQFRVIAPDTRGSGATTHPGGPATFDVLTDDVIALIEVLELDRPFVAGFSEGGATATLVALQRPDLVGGLVNHGGFDYFDPDAPSMPMFRMLFGGRPDATSADPDAAERTIQTIPDMKAVFDTMKADYDGAQGEGHWRDYLGQLFDRHVAPFGHTVAELATLSVPTLFLVGDRDFCCSVELACTVYRTVPGAALGVVPQTGHEITAAIVATMADFFATHSVSA
jgi:pimeloyl-ACP methyl ester carboxylesterase